MTKRTCRREALEAHYFAHTRAMAICRRARGISTTPDNNSLNFRPHLLQLYRSQRTRRVVPRTDREATQPQRVTYAYAALGGTVVNSGPLLPGKQIIRPGHTLASLVSRALGLNRGSGGHFL